MIFYGIGYVITAWIASDFLAGIWHWLEDRYFDVEWPIIGKYIAKPNKLHHDQPLAFLAGNYWQRNWTAFVPSMIACGIALLFGQYWLATMFAMTSQANEVHAWAHSKGKVSNWVAMLQLTGLFQSPRQHALHHTSPFADRYCVSSDWLNPILDSTGFWRGVEWLIAKTTGLKPWPLEVTK
jgi:hypothetical protein